MGLGADVPTVPPELTQTNTNPAGVLAVAAGQDYLLALRTNGSVMAWGTGYGANNLPAFTNAVGVAAGNFNGVVVKGDGTVQTWGVNSFGGLNIPGELTNRSTNTFVRAVSAVAGYQYTLVLRADGTVRGWGRCTDDPALGPDEHERNEDQSDCEFGGGETPCGGDAEGWDGDDVVAVDTSGGKQQFDADSSPGIEGTCADGGSG